MTFIIKAIVNPNNIKPDAAGYYPKSVFIRVPDYFLFAIYCFGSLAVLSFILIRPYSESKVEEKNEKLDIEDIFLDEDENPKHENNIGENEVDLNKSINEEKNQINEKVVKEVRTVKLRKAIFSKQNIILFFLGFTNYCKKFLKRFSNLLY